MLLPPSPSPRPRVTAPLLGGRAGRRLLASGLLAAALLRPGPAGAGHEFPFYPSFYPQEITIEVVAPADAPRRLADGTLHAYAGADPFGGATGPASVGSVESLEALVVVTPEARDAASRCTAGHAAAAALGPARDGWRPHRFPVTPLHPDWLHHADRATAPPPAAPSPVRRLRLRALDPAAEALISPDLRATTPPLDATVHAVPLASLLGDQAPALNGWGGLPWRRTGWLHAHRLLAPAVQDPGRKGQADAAVRRLTSGEPLTVVEQANLERDLVARLTEGCERVVAGYTVRRERFSGDYSAGVEHVGHDALTGLDSAVFPRTVKLKDFPWNGWLTVGVPESPAAAWNPLGGFDDLAGRLIWSALGDLALFPAAHGPGWIANRVTAERLDSGTGRVAVPAEARRPAQGTGELVPVPPGRTAAAHLRYRVLASAFHDGTRLTAGDLVYPFVLAARWGTPPAAGAPTPDPELAARTALVRERLAGLQILRVETAVLAFGEDKLTYEVPVVDLYLDHAGPDGSEVAAVAPPWTTVPWHVLALLEEAERRGIGALTRGEAARQGRPWLDMVRDPAVVAALARLVDELAAARYRPRALADLATPEEAHERWAALKAFHAAHGHFLVANGPYRLTAWTDRTAVLQVFRDLSYPRGVGSFDRLAYPLRARVVAARREGAALVVTAEVEKVERAGRDVRIVREPFVKRVSEQDQRSLPVARYLAIGGDGRVLEAGQVAATDPGTFRIEPGPGTRTLVLALTLDDVTALAPAQVIPWTP